MPGFYRILLGVLCGALLATGSQAQPGSLPGDGPIRFTHLTIDDGLSQQSVHAVLQDRRGFMWFGTKDGLNRYDGYDFIHYRHDPNSLSIDPIFALLEDRDDKIWIGHGGGGLSRASTSDFRFMRTTSATPLTTYSASAYRHAFPKRN